MKISYILCAVFLTTFSSQPPADQTPRIGQTNSNQELLIQKNDFELDPIGQVLTTFLQIHHLTNPPTSDQRKWMNEMAKMYENHITLPTKNTIHEDDKTDEKNK